MTKWRGDRTRLRGIAALSGSNDRQLLRPNAAQVEISCLGNRHADHRVNAL